MVSAPNDKKPRELVTRIVTAAALIAVALVAILLGGIVFWAIGVALGMLMMTEWADLVGARPQPTRLALYALVVPLAIMAPLLGAGPGFLALGLIGAAIFFLFFFFF